MSQRVVELAESLNTYMPLAPGDERIEERGYVIWIGAGGEHPAFTVVQRFRLDEAAVTPTVAAIRGVLKRRGRTRATWEIGPSATPADLEQRLLSLGLVPFEEPLATGMLLRQALPAIDSAVVVRRAVTVDDYVAGFAVLSGVFGERTESAAERRARAEREIDQHRGGRGALFVGLIDDEPIAAATAVYTPDAVVLGGAATVVRARGRGAYRALVAARYADAVARGTPTLVIQAGAMSRPILDKLGFERVAEIRILLDTV